jgi:predicted Zn-dependent peptidase
MKINTIKAFVILSFCFFSQLLWAQQAEKFSFVSFPENPLHARIYTLANGLKIYLTVYKDAPRIQTYIVVKAGSKNDPSSATGLAHYLEHMLFKGTDAYGSKDYSQEKVQLNKIVDLYEIYRAELDSFKRKNIYHRIDSISGIASQFAIANEYDKLMSGVGAQGTNAYTSFEQTVYVNDIPANQMEKWLTIEAERFRRPVMRLFHTELEAVYEEKNRGLDNDGSKMVEALFEGLFPTHPYGTQTTIGTIEHLKSPSIKKIQEYYDTYYVPNNMAICLSGDFDMEATIKMINASWGQFKSKPVPLFTAPVEAPLAAPVLKTVHGPNAETMLLAYRFQGASSRDADMIKMIDKILYNGTAGLMDLNLNQTQKVLHSSSGVFALKDYSIHVLDGDPREGQKLEEIKNLLLAQLEEVKKGAFPDWLPAAIISEMKLDQIKAYERNSSRAEAFVNAFVLDEDWQEYSNEIQRLSKITKEEIMAFAKEHYKANYVLVNKLTGEDTLVKKIVKPVITPVAINRNDVSPFVKKMLEQKVTPLQPVFLNYKEDIHHLKIKNNVAVNYKHNTENNLFNLYYVFEMGSNNSKKLGIAIGYLPYLGTSTYSPPKLQQEFYKLGVSFNVFNSEDRVYVSLSGLNENFEKALALFESVLSDVQPDQPALDNMVKDILKSRADAKLNKQVILNTAMANYGKYGAKSAFTNILSAKELKEIKAAECVKIIKELDTYEHHILYYGPADTAHIVASLHKLHKLPAVLKPVPEAVKFDELPTDKSKVFVMHYDMKQAEILMLSKSETFNKQNLSVMSLYNEYYGGGMSSIVFQEMRESKALAYSVYSSYTTPSRLHKSHYVVTYIGTQADKLPEALHSMTELLNTMPESTSLFEASKAAIVQKIQTERITKMAVLFSYERAVKLGLDHDYRKEIYEEVPKLNFKDMSTFHEKYIKDRKYSIMVLGDKNKLDMGTLNKYGPVKFLTLEEVFGY